MRVSMAPVMPGDEASHGVGGDADAGGVDLRAADEVADGLHEVDLHEAGEALAPVGAGEVGRWADPGVVGSGAGGFVDVAFAFADGVVGDDHGSGFGEEDAAVEGIPAELVAAVAVDDDDAGKLALPVGYGGVWAVDDGGDEHSSGGGVGDAVGEDAGSGGEGGPGLGFEGGEGGGDVELLADEGAPGGEAGALPSGGEGGGGGEFRDGGAYARDSALGWGGAAVGVRIGLGWGWSLGEGACQDGGKEESFEEWE